MEKKTTVKVEISPEYDVPQVIIKAGERNEYVERLIKAIEDCNDPQGGKRNKINVYDGERAVLLDRRDIVRAYIEKRKLVVRTFSDAYESRLSLRQFEEVLDSDIFVRVSRFEIVNLSKVSCFDMSISGTIRITFEDGTDTWVARRCVHNIHDRLTRMEKGGKSNE